MVHLNPLNSPTHFRKKRVKPSYHPVLSDINAKAKINLILIIIKTRVQDFNLHYSRVKSLDNPYPYPLLENNPQHSLVPQPPLPTYHPIFNNTLSSKSLKFSASIEEQSLHQNSLNGFRKRISKTQKYERKIRRN